MFSLHETTRIRLCRAAFVALCLGPLCAVLAWSVVVQLDWYRQAHEGAIGARLGWTARLDEASTPRPHLMLYRGLDLSDPNNGQLLARLPFVEIDSSGEAVVVRLPYPAIVNGTRLDAFWKLAQELARSAGAAHVRFEARNLTMHLDDGEQSFTDLLGEFDGNEGQALGKLSFCRALAGSQASEPCEVMLTRSRHAGSLVHSIELSTGNTPLPSSLIASIWPGALQLGKTCAFAGRISAIEQSGMWRTEFRGELTRIDLDLLVSPFPHKLSGLASARLDRVTIVDGRLENAAGSFTAGPGEISRSLVQSAETHLHVRAADQAISGPSNSLPYQQLCVGFEVGPDGMTLRGAVPRTNGALLVDNQFVLVEEAPVSIQPVVDLVRTLVPRHEVQVPATRETALLTSALQMPSISPEPGQEQPIARPLNVTPRPTAGIRREWPPLGTR
jgi:hypothetical protein